MTQTHNTNKLSGIETFFKEYSSSGWLAILATLTSFSTAVIAQFILRLIGPASFGGMPLIVLNMGLVALGLVVAGLGIWWIDRRLDLQGTEKRHPWLVGGLTLFVALISGLSSTAIVFALGAAGLPLSAQCVLAGIVLAPLFWLVGRKIQKLGKLRSTDKRDLEKNSYRWCQGRPDSFPQPDSITTLVLAMSTGKDGKGEDLWKTFGKSIHVDLKEKEILKGICKGFKNGHDFGTDEANIAAYGKKHCEVKNHPQHIKNHPWVQPLRLLHLLLRNPETGRGQQGDQPALNIHVYVADEWTHEKGCRNNIIQRCAQTEDYTRFKTILKAACRALGRTAKIHLIEDDKDKFISHFDWDSLEARIRTVIDNSGADKDSACIVDITSGRAAYSAAATMACLQSSAKITYVSGTPGKSTVYLRRNFRGTTAV